MVDERRGVVVFLDALGVKGKWETDSGFIDKWKTVRKGFQTYTAMAQKFFDENFRAMVENELRKLSKDTSLSSKLIPKFNSVFFSDTVIITASLDKDVPSGFPIEVYIPFVGHTLIAPFLAALRNDILFRGSISVGRLYLSVDTSLTVGPAVDEAAEYYRLPDWIGISTAPSATIALRHSEIPDLLSQHFVEYDIPLKSGVEKNGYALAWPRLERLDAFYESGKGREHRKYIEKHIEPQKFMNKPLSFPVYTKYRNTMLFYNHIKNNLDTSIT